MDGQGGQNGRGEQAAAEKGEEERGGKDWKTTAKQREREMWVWVGG